MDRLRSARVFTKLDLCGAYNLVHIVDSDKWKTVFRMWYGSYEFQVMHYSFMNAPASFQQFMNKVFKDMLDVSVVVYLDNILVYSDNPDDHVKHVRQVLKHLHTNDLFVKVNKCDFGVDTTNFLGFIVSPDGLKMDDVKIQVICDWPAP